MDNIFLNLPTIRNSDNPFTELFSLLTRYENTPVGLTTLAYDSKELKDHVSAS